MQLITLEDASTYFPAYGVPPAFAHILQGLPVHPALDDYWRRPYILFSEPDLLWPWAGSLAAYDMVIPMCEEGDVTALIACAVHGQSTNFLHLLYESGDPPIVFHSYQSLLLPIFRFRLEAHDSPASLASLAEILQFQHLDAVAEILRHPSLTDEEQHQRFRDLHVAVGG